MKPNYVYVASSWRNDKQPEVVQALRDAGIDCYDFKNPTGKDDGFHWSEVMESFDRDKQLCHQDDYLSALKHARALEGFAKDFNAMKQADTCVLILPCGRSAHLELGWFVGEKRQTIIMLDGPEVTPELMYLMADHIVADTQGVLEIFNRHEGFVPKNLDDAVNWVMTHADRERFPKGMAATDVLDVIREEFGRNAFPLVSVLDVHDSLREMFS